MRVAVLRLAGAHALVDEQYPCVYSYSLNFVPTYLRSLEDVLPVLQSAVSELYSGKETSQMWEILIMGRPLLPSPSIGLLP